MKPGHLKKLNIIQTPVRYLPDIGGVHKYVEELSCALTQQNHTVTVVCANEPTSPPNEQLNGVNVVRLPYLAKVADTNITPRLLPTLLRQKFDVIHTHIPTPWSADISALISLLRRKPLVVTYHNDLEGEGFADVIAKIYNATLLKFVLHRASAIIITQPKYLDYSKHLKPYKRKVMVVPLGVSTPRQLTIQKKPRQLFFLSILDKHHEYKGLNLLLSAMQEVVKAYPDARLIVGGGGNLVDKYKARAVNLGISKNVRFLGFVPDDDLPSLYASSTAFVLPSTTSREGFGIVALEALSYGTAAITTDLAGSSTFIKQKNAGLIVPPGDTDALTKAILNMLNDPAEAEAMGLRGADAVKQQFDWQAIARRITNIYDGKPAPAAKLPKIIQISAYYPPHLGGQEIAVQDLATQLAAAGEKIEVVTSDLGGSPGVSVENGVRVTRLRSSEFAHTAIIWSMFFWLLKHAERDTVVHLHVGQVFTPEVVWLASKIKGFKYIMHMHIDPVQSGSMGKFLPLYKKLFLAREIRGASTVVVLNNEHQRTIRQDYKYGGNLRVMSNGINDDYFKIIRKPVKSKTLNLLFVGRLSPQKNLSELLEAINLCKQKVKLDIIGEGECRQELEEIIRNKKLNNVTLHGKLSRDEVKKFYATCDAFILPSLYEAQPLVLLEAMAARIPILASDVHGISEHVKAMAILFEPTRVGITKGVETMMSFNKDDLRSMIDKASERACHLKWEELIDNYRDIYAIL